MIRNNTLRQTITLNQFGTLTATQQVDWILDECDQLLQNMQVEAIRIAYDAGTVKTSFELDRELLCRVLKPSGKVQSAKRFIETYKDYTDETRLTEETNFYTATRIDTKKWNWDKAGATWQTKIGVQEVWERAVEVATDFKNNPVYSRYAKIGHARYNAYGSCKHAVIGLAARFLLIQYPQDYDFLDQVERAFKTNFILNNGDLEQIPAYKIFKYHLSVEEKDDIQLRQDTDQSTRYIKPAELATLVLEPKKVLVTTNNIILIPQD